MVEISYIKHQVSYYEYFFLIALQHLVKMARYLMITSPDLTAMYISYKVDGSYLLGVILTLLSPKIAFL